MIGSDTIVDMGSAASRLTLSEQSNVTDIFLSHAHLDHTKDLAFFSENIFKLVTKPVRVRGTEDTVRTVREHLLNNRIWPDFTELPTKSERVLSYEPFERKKALKMPGFEMYAVPVNHPGGCEALFFSTPNGTVLYTGDTGPTEEVWEEAKKRKESLKAVLLEASFPNRLESLAHLSGHLTPRLLEGELEKLGGVDVPVFTYHMKVPYQEETKKELMELSDSRIRILEPGMKIEF
jgi:cAMP phosphodiesterase